MGSAICTQTSNALLSLNTKHCLQTSSLQLPFRSVHDIRCQNRDSPTSSCLMANAAGEDTSSSGQPTRRKRVVRMTTSKRGNVVIKAPRISSNHRKVVTKKHGDKYQEGQPAAKNINASVRISPNLASGAVFQRNEMVEHTLLTKEEEFQLGRSVVKARALREQIENLVEERKYDDLKDDEYAHDSDAAEVDLDFLTYELEYLAMYGFRPGEKQEYDLLDDLLIDHSQHRSHHLNQLKNGIVDSSSLQGNKRSGYRNGSSSSTASNNSYTPLLHIPIHQLSELDVISLGIEGGKAEAIDILLEGAHAREVLMRQNIKLVISIAKNWMKNSFSTENANLGASSSQKQRRSQLYDGSWDRPSLDEAVQEGVLGLARAVDRYDPERGLRFGTYATHWVTSYVRVCFQRAVTGCLRVPSQLHDIKTAYKRIVKDHYHSSETPPAMKAIAKELGITEQRLNTAIRATTPLVSVDAPMILPGSGRYKGSAAGGDGGNSQELMILDTLRW